MPLLGDTDALGFAYWPFSVVPDANSTLLWADRQDLLRQVSRLLRRLMGHQASTIHLLWADFGAGKTHTLLFMRQLALTESSGSVLPIYTALPKASRTFVDVYRAIIGGIGVETLLAAHTTLRRSSSLAPRAAKLLSQAAPEVALVLEALRIGNATIKQTATRWLLADPSLTKRELDSASLLGKIRTADDAITVLSATTKLLILSGHPRVLIMIDEFQRTGVLRRAYLDEINAGLHTYFNACPQGLSLVLSFSFGSATNIKHYLNDELRSRADPAILTIPALDRDNALIFLHDLVDNARGTRTSSIIDPEVFTVMVELVTKLGAVSPRKLIQVADAVLSEASMDLADGVIGSVDTDYARGLLARMRPADEEPDEE